ncbi:hypothetical protein CAP48_03880, partial [Advenella sp. S44]|uniref:TPM domain-containing protein n=1 Tax=Advenella sp. S44 TaxID=1982755 RepID=UPI000C2A9188
GNKWEWLGLDGLEGWWLARRIFSDSMMERLTQEIRKSEARHAGELVLAIEHDTPGHSRDTPSRALEVFGRLKVWDTPERSGLLLYISLNKHKFEIVADRGIRVDPKKWEEVCAILQTRFAAKEYEQGLLQAIHATEAILQAACGDQGTGDDGHNYLPDAPVLL